MRHLRTTLAVTALLVTAPAFATNGVRMIGFGPAQNSMGGVGVGLTLDGNALASNPAGIGDLGPRLDVGLGWFSAGMKHEATGTPTGLALPMPPSLIAHDGGTVSKRVGLPIPSLAYVQPLGQRLTAGVGLFAVSGIKVDYPANIYLSEAKVDYLDLRLAPGVAYRLGDTISVGATINVMMAQLGYDVAGSLPPAMGGQAKHSTATSWGYGATLGVKVTPMKALTLGAAYETRSHFQDFRYDVPGGTDRLKLDLPQMATLGASVRPVDALIVAADVEWINWSATMGEGLPEYAERQPTTATWSLNWKDQWVLKIGAQVRLVPTLHLRVGYNHGKMPLDRSRAFENLVFPALAEDHFTAGADWALTSSVSLLLSAMYSPEAKLSGSNGGPPPSGQMISSYSTSMSQLQVDAGVSFTF